VKPAYEKRGCKNRKKFKLIKSRYKNVEEVQKGIYIRSKGKGVNRCTENVIKTTILNPT
jgi:hypothetical protein